MSFRLARLSLMVAAAWSPLVLAQPAPPAARDTIVVTGKPLTRDEARTVSRAYVRGVVALPVSGQYARWKDRICPHVIGLSAANGAIVEDKVRASAREAGARVAEPGCRANLDIVFTDDSDAQIRTILLRSSRMLVKMSLADRDALVHGAQPVRWWYGTRTEGLDGHQMTAEPAALLGAHIDGAGPGFISSGEGQYVDGYDATLIGTRVRSNFESACIIVDLNRAGGRTLGAVAAYVALVALAQIRMGAAADAGDSVLGLFGGATPVANDLTRRDRAFLKALYRIPINRERQQQATAIAAEMTRLLAQD